MKRSTGSVVILGSALMAACPAFAGDVAATSRIDTVTVYPDGASVGRIAHVDLPAGASAIVLRGLASAIDPNSIRVEGSAQSALTIGAVDLRTVPADPDAAANPELEKQIKALQAEREGIQVRLQALEAKKASITTFAQASPEKLGPGTAPLPLEQWQGVWDKIGDALAEVGKALAERTHEIAEIDRKIGALEQARGRAPRPGAPLRDLVIAVEAAAATTGDLHITYRVIGASWQPLYDARLDTGSKDAKPSLTFVRRARITQRTGEDWSDVALSVSTVRASRGTAAPDPQPLLVNLYEPIEVPRPAPLARAPAAAMSERQYDGGGPPPAAKAAAQAIEQVAELEAGTFQASFKVPGKVSVAQDGTAKAVALSSRSSEPTLAVKTVPAADETAYIEAAFVNDEDAPLLPGEVTLTRDGTYVGRGRLKLIAPGDRVELGFGADDKVKVSRVTVKKREADGSWVNNTRTDQREFKTVIRNLHATPLRITVFDSLPVSEHASITVEQLPATTVPTDRSVADRRGVMAWTYDYAPGEQKEIRLAYRLKWPADRDLVFKAQQ